MNLSHLVRRSSIVASVLITLLVPVHAFSNPGFFPNWTVSEFRPHLEQGGRTNTVAVHPTDRTKLFAASDSGGLFQSVDGGLTWTHVDSLPVNFTQSVAYLPANPLVVLVTAKVDFKTTNGGGIWRSDDGGATWTQAYLERPNPPNPPLSGFGISAIGDDVVVGTSDGAFVSIDGGPWRFSFPFVGDVRSVLLEPGEDDQLRRVYAAGPTGLRVGTLFGNQLDSWVNPGNFIGGSTIGLHALGRSALSPNQAFVTSGHQLFRTEDRGAHWTEVPLPLHGTPTCGGTPFIKTALRTRGASKVLDLYHGNACGVDRLRVPAFPSLPDYSGPWEPLAVGHFTRDLAMYGAEPLLLASNGGLHNTADGGATWTYVGGGSGGYNALQVTSITGQYVGKNQHIDLYFATQDNNIWSVDSAGNKTGQEPDVTEGFHIEAERRVMFGAASPITYVGCNGCAPRFAKRFLQNPEFVLHGHSPLAAPVLIGKNERIQQVDGGLDVTSDPNLASWQPFASFSANFGTLPKLGFAGQDGSKIVYQPYSHFTSRWLLRIEHSAGIANVIQPAMAGFGSLAVNRSMPFAFHPVYDADRDTGLHLIASDDQQMLRTITGGDMWEVIPGLKEYVMDDNKLQFRAKLPDIQTPMPLVTAISFFPDDPSQVLIGTSEGGIYHSYDRGETWGRIEGSRDATSITSFFWASINTVYVSTFGRGLWRLNNQPIALPEAFDQLCPTCDVVSPDRVRPPFDRSALVFGGELLGMRAEKSQLREIFVTPGSSVVFTGDPKDPQQNITITESDGKGSYEQMPKPPTDGWIATGVVFTRDATLTGTVFNPSELSLVPPKSGEKGK